MSEWVGDCEPAAVYNEARRRARKPHKCSACAETIQPRHTYWRVCIIYDGDVETVKRCERCQTLHRHLRTLRSERRGWDTWPSERLDCGEDYFGHWGAEPPPEIAALAFTTPEEMQARKEMGNA